MKAILVCVNYADMLRVTLPYNIHHFKDIYIVTSHEDKDTINVANENNSELYPFINTYKTDAFYRNGADFNKWLALEEGLDYFNLRYPVYDGWLCLMDADVLWPKDIPMLYNEVSDEDSLTPNCLYTPRRRMLLDPPRGLGDVIPFPSENAWRNYPLHRQEKEFAGYSQIFHTRDIHLGDSPWHQTNWRHAGGADSLFQAKWPESNKIRPPFEVLHIGEAGRNWCGRITNSISVDNMESVGSLNPDMVNSHEEAEAYYRIQTERQKKWAKLQGYWQERRRRSARGLDPYKHEKLGGI
jgi:hypothetical protein